MITIDIQVSRSENKVRVKPVLYMLGKGGISVLQTSILKYYIKSDCCTHYLQVYNVLQLILEGKWTFLKVWVDSTENPCVLVMRADKVKCQVFDI